MPHHVPFHTFTVLVYGIVRKPLEAKPDNERLRLSARVGGARPSATLWEHNHELMSGVLRLAQNDRGGAPVTRLVQLHGFFHYF